MNKYDMTEIAYRNGYEAGIRKFAEMLKEIADGYGLCDDGVIYKMVDVEDIDETAKELIEGVDNE